MRSRSRLAFCRGSLSITDDGLRIADRALLRALVLDRVQVSAVAIDDGKAVDVVGSPRRFAVEASNGRYPSDVASYPRWLWTGPYDASTPTLAAGHEAPNVLLMFSAPFPALRRRGHDPPREGRPVSGLALCVGNVAAARDAFDRWGVLGPPRELDPVAGARIGESESWDVRQAVKVGWIFVAAGLVPGLALFALEGIEGLRDVAPWHASALTLGVVVVTAATTILLFTMP